MSDTLLKLALGQIGGNTHPIHPATVHLPIAFLVTSSILDITTFLGIRNPSLVAPLAQLAGISYVPALLTHLSLFSYISTIAGIVTAVPAILTGGAELLAMIKNKGLDLQNPVVSTTLLHAGLNDLAIVGAVFNWYSRRDREGYFVEGQNAFVALATLGAVGYSAFLGGSLVYKHGYSVRRMGEGKKEKEEEVKKTKKQGKKEL